MPDITDRQHMTRALQLARRGLHTTDPNPRVGCVLVRDGDVVGEGWHQRAGEPHAERHALAAAGDRARGATCYVTLEPCSHTGRTGPCADALVEAGVARVVAAMRDPNPQVAGQGLERLRGAGIEVQCGVLEDAARALNPGFVRRMEQGLPWVRVKLAMSVDGRTAMASGESQWITGAEAREDVQRLRARSSAIVTGIGTVLADAPSLTVRPATWQLSDYGPTPVRQPLRVVLDRALRTPVDAAVIRAEGACLILTTAETAHAQVLREAGADVLAGDWSPRQVLAELAGRGCNEVLVEAGAELAGAFVAAGCVDELVVYMAPMLLGSSARPLLALPGLDRMADKYLLTLRDTRQVGVDLRLCYALAPR
ncbi:(S)-2-hydroxy-fatty-acid dehydrogenase [Alcanivorax sp. S71-1-4]|jgi:diaminohydroxyphosphoribosylaminopyrimidine deaminase / 5-amino-6-(5-phosphoribosylamino)uracil reductase|uniref:bifunctional diaminohydroxyphosphoribosylaminopyrimidine deaminase/5-amino-6-(5-phosphoribosylamino)uracil reductase RibD n=1 Tax=Alcanivorax sp. S71-1-4 TaxID=1177159 RepID=UPI00135CA5B5|nr:bifunctional diaminohydroxyphosphoribosylaminopyrimidine deaminase/5-amino-6-(5-phosphoribosylamino)uracil reductase RibD [Alcanivorax sp. S71-1-4]KAF0810745.1 (S)-2-hydroxy-fatty-acid dehydrogenase [Alcanivorax sp. S71-1-4]